MLNKINLDRINETLDAVKADPALDRAEFSVNANWEGGVRNRINVRDFPALYSDEPTELAGEDSSPNPAEYILSGAMTCFATTFEILATTEGVKLDSVNVNVSSSVALSQLFDESYFDEIAVRIKVESPEPAQRIHELAEKALKASPMLRSLRANKTLIVE